MRAKDLMIPLQDYLRPDNTLKEAVNLLKTAKRGEERVGVKGLPVIDEKGRLVGMLSMRDILKAVFPFYLSMMELGDFTWDGMVEGIAEKSSNRLVRDVMSKVVVTVNDDAPLMECVDHMIKHNIKRLPVIDKSGRVIGMLYERDIFFAITNAMLEENKQAIDERNQEKR
ncbi:MAG: HPP family protein [Thermodesulfovibrionales bacterium]